MCHTQHLCVPPSKLLSWMTAGSCHMYSNPRRHRKGEWRHWELPGCVNPGTSQRKTQLPRGEAPACVNAWLAPTLMLYVCDVCLVCASVCVLGCVCARLEPVVERVSDWKSEILCVWGVVFVCALFCLQVWKRTHLLTDWQLGWLMYRWTDWLISVCRPHRNCKAHGFG